MKFLNQVTVEHFYIGLKILNQLIAEMHQANPGLPLTHHRKTACSFRDLALLQVFQISLTSLRQLQNDASGEKLQEQAIGLALKCLSFDFVGTSLDESSEDIGTIQIPSSWRAIVEDVKTVQIFFDYYAITKPPISSESLECLVRLASVRRSLFSGETERSKYLISFMRGTRDILQYQQGLGQHENYHEYCRLLGRLKTNYQLSELVNVEIYGDWIRLVAEFTMKSLESWQWASGSVYYLLGLWSRLVSSVAYLKSDCPSLLDDYVPQITESYIKSRFDSVQAVVDKKISEDPLEHREQLQDQLDSLPYLCRFQYEKTSSYIIDRLEPVLEAYTNAGRFSTSKTSSDLTCVEGQLTWLIHIIGGIIRGRQSSSTSEIHEVIDGDLAARVFQLIQVMDSGVHIEARYNERSKQRLDLAILIFFQNFRRVYVGDQAMHSSKQLYLRLGELVGLQDHVVVLNIIVQKIATNLKRYRQSDEVIGETLALFQELAAGYMSGKMLLKLDAVNFILGHHTKDFFPFLDEFGSTRNRTLFYFTLGRLLFMEDSPSKFKAFVAPLQKVFMMLEEMADSGFRSNEVKCAIIGLMRDLRGLTMATNSRRTYGLVFDWLYPTHVSLFVRIIQRWTDTPEVMTPLLKFMAEFVLNKTQRLAFDSSSPNGILLFREVSKVIVAYGTIILSQPVSADPYTYLYKGIWITLTILTRALAGNYVNFGVFELYGDQALSSALEIALKMSLAIPLVDVLAFRKLARAYFGLLEVLCHNHTAVIVNLETEAFAHIVGSLEFGLKSLDVSISSQCASAVDSLAGFYFSKITTGESRASTEAVNMTRHLSQCPNIFLEILKTLFELVLLEDCANQWSLSRPMLSLILISEQIYSNLRAQLLSSQPSDQQHRLAECFDKLMADVARTIEPKNRDKFTQNLTVFRHEFRAT
ncbi:hypothetical protein MARPO_0017s0001 [Marchantia polymorpha]|uniref:Exportin-7/Ran-binding protein 17 TPR repeats domain-containing protein n=2 Tax=Marchantia polymorpha TaxID=3197 RepID=A0A2R6XFJ1_MARPO|nr:hypothetical protein MARPO_0017s0001 [Marchantia polymorpha]PTQ44864.1 hypothetical protein MARPO_0017s0001 [Marchantia polymorpha]|eukprot:PTQ44851.1 hypothetical protein MARPO_0017s0001 [Marchantia polymorpha]